MKRRINSTGRKSISREFISIRVVEPATPNLPPSFTADLSKLSELGLAEEARVYVEPYVTRSSALMRFDFGPLGALAAPFDTSLTELDASGRILFRVKIVDQSGEVGKILASANALRPIDEKRDENDRRAILPVASDDLGEAVWELDLQATARPELVINNQIPGLMDRLKTDPLLQGAILPAAISQILRYVLDTGDGTVDDEIDWVRDWRQWATDLLEKPLDEYVTANEDLDEAIRGLIETFVTTSKFVSRLPPADL
jgi:hypothetical protein